MGCLNTICTVVVRCPGAVSLQPACDGAGQGWATSFRALRASFVLLSSRFRFQLVRRLARLSLAPILFKQLDVLSIRIRPRPTPHPRPLAAPSLFQDSARFFFHSFCSADSVRGNEQRLRGIARANENGRCKCVGVRIESFVGRPEPFEATLAQTEEWVRLNQYIWLRYKQKSER